MTLYARGYYHERRTAALLRADGYFVVESRGSRGPADLCAVKRGQVLLVQCKSGRAALTSGEWNALYDVARRAGALPIVADWPARGAFRLRRITGRHESRSRTWPAEPFTADEVAERGTP